MVPVDGVTFIITHSGQKYASGLRLLDNIFDNLRPPIVVLSVIQRISSNSQSFCWTKDDAPVAADTVLLVASYFVIVGVIGMNIEGALVDAHLASNAPRVVSLDHESWR